ncbi:alpha/beta fold hydrolase [Sphingomonas sp. Leaf10]|uniref:alpha/beta fold hydrolase n=1 Tax=Sphingomonas sp. Leaf10 TaxID=1735676 RepID=UPI0006F846CC|nr:alpha/beta hydrolase [Sphingomonas sp. Leaf10]KQM30477.1 alpha/beta hydrolase [Sphingomonas sp. Leaf10]
MTALRRIALSTGVSLDVAVAGNPGAPAMIFLHGFPESHRTWRHQLSEFARDHQVIAPDQRGYARSDKPATVADYAPDRIVADLIALANALGVGRFTLVGHDWGGAIAWMAALRHPDRIERLIILNAPHPLIFQRSLFDDPDQRAASQYITKFRDTSIDRGLIGSGLEHFFATGFAKLVTRTIVGADKAAYLDEWSQPGAMTAMLNWYRASAIIVPAPGETPERPAWLDASFPPVTQPTLVIWGTRDKALLPVQVEGLETVVPDLTVVKVDAGHFVPWEAPEAVNEAIRDWLSAPALRSC